LSRCRQHDAATGLLTACGMSAAHARCAGFVARFMRHSGKLEDSLDKAQQNAPPALMPARREDVAGGDIASKI